MSKLRKAILIIGILVIVVAASLGTALALYATGSVKTDPIELEFRLKDREKVYDGTPLVLSNKNFADPKNSDIELSRGSLPSDYSIKVEFLGSQTDAGWSESDADIKIYDENGFNVTSNYIIKVHSAKLKVEPKTISVELPSQKVVYNGSKVQFDEYRITGNSDGGLCRGHKIYGSTNAELLNVGDTLPDDLEPLIFDVAGNDVTSNYEIADFIKGEIEVVKRSITVRPVSYEKVYDGIDLIADEIEFVEGSLVEGQTVEFVINEGYTNHLKDVGETETNITSLKIYETIGEEKIEVTDNYEFNLKEYDGLLKITPRPLTVTGKSATFTYNGEEQSLKRDTEALSVEGLADGEELYSVSYVKSLTNVGTTENTIGEVILKGSLENYDITKVNGTLEITPYVMTYATRSAEKYYDGDPLTEDESDYLLVKSGHTIRISEESGELPSITEVGEIYNAYTVSVVDVNNGSDDVTRNYAITYEYGTLTVKRLPVKVTLENGADREKVTYDGNSHTPSLSNEAYFAVAPLLPEGETAPLKLTCADFEVLSETREMRDAGEHYYSVKFKDTSSEERRKYSNYELFVPESGILEITPLSVTVTLKSYTNGDAFTYSGKAVKIDATQAITGIKLPNGAALPGTVRLSNKDFTVVADEIIDAGTDYTYTVKIADAKVAGNYDVKIAEKSAVTVNPMAVTLKLADVERTYNGEKQTVDVAETVLSITRTLPIAESEDVNDVAGLTKSDLKLDFKDGSAEHTDAKDYPFSVSALRKKTQNNYALSFKDVTDKAVTEAQLKINKFELTVTTDTCEFTYNDGNQSSGLFTNGALANKDHKIKLATAVNDLPKVRNVGDSVSNIFDVEINNGTNKVTGNYEVKYDYGTLSVKRRAIMIVTDGSKRDYDGTPLTCKKVKEDESVGLITGHKITVETATELTNFGKTQNVLVCDIKSNNVSVKNNYAITYEYGMLEVTRRAITVKTGSSGIIEKYYDGNSLSNNNASIGESELRARFGVKLISEPTSIINAGSVENRFECAITDKNNGNADVTDNFVITYDYGTLTIKPVKISFELSDFVNSMNVDMEYDGQPKKFDVKEAVKNITVTGKAANGADTELNYKIGQTTAGSSIKFEASDFEIVYSAPLIDAGSYLYTVKFVDEAFGNNFVVEDEAQISHTVRVKQKKIALELDSFTYGFENREYELKVSEAIRHISDVKGDEVDNEVLSYKDFVIVCSEKLLNAGDYKYKVKIEDESFAKNFLCADAEGNVTIKQADITVSLKNYKYTYSGKEFVISDDAIEIIGNEYPELISYRDFTFATTDGASIIDARTYTYGTAIADQTKARNFRIVVEEETDKGATIVIEQAKVTVSPNTVDLTFNGKEQSLDGASALRINNDPTSLLTAADFTFTVMQEGKETVLYKSGDYSYTAILNNPNFALEGNATGAVNGTVKVAKCVVTVTLNDFDKEYDGKAYVFKPQTAILTVDSDMFGLGDFDIVYDEVNPAADHSAADDYKLKAVLAEKYDEIEDDVTIVTANNEFTISKRSVTITTQTATFVYDGAEHSAYDKPVLVGEVKGHYAKVDQVVSVKEVSNTPYVNSVKYEIFCKDGSETEKKVTANYEIEYVNGTLEVTHRHVTVTTATDSREYNGSEFKNSTTKCDGLVDGHTHVNPENFHGITEVGKIENRFDGAGIAIFDETAEEVTHNYAITYVYGELEVKAVEIKVTFVEGANTDYTGDDISVTGSAVIGSIELVNAPSGGALPNAEDFDVLFDRVVIDAGSYSFTVEVKSDKHPERYDIKSGVGRLKVNKLKLNVTLKNYTGAQAKVYTGEVQTASASDITVVGNDKISRNDFTITYQREMLNAGSYTYGAELKDETVRGNYELTYSGGNYEITAADIVITLKDYVQTYNGKAYTIDVADAVVSITDAANVASTLLKAGELSPKYVQELRLAGDKKYEVEVADSVKAKNFNITISGGDFTINKRKLTFTVANIYMSKEEYEMYSSDYKIDVAENVSVSVNTPLAEGDQLVVKIAEAERQNLETMTFLLNAFRDGEIELTNKDCYEFTNINGTTPASVQLVTY